MFGTNTAMFVIGMAGSGKSTLTKVIAGRKGNGFFCGTIDTLSSTTLLFVSLSHASSLYHYSDLSRPWQTTTKTFLLSTLTRQQNKVWGMDEFECYYEEYTNIYSLSSWWNLTKQTCLHPASTSETPSITTVFERTTKWLERGGGIRIFLVVKLTKHNKDS